MRPINISRFCGWMTAMTLSLTFSGCDSASSIMMPFGTPTVEKQAEATVASLVPTSKGPQEITGRLRSLLKVDEKVPQPTPVAAARIHLLHKPTQSITEFTTDMDGYFQVQTPLPDGTYQVKVTATLGQQAVSQEIGSVEVLQGRPLASLDLLMGTGALQGKVLLEGRGHAAEVTVRLKNTAIPAVKTDSAGRFTIYNISPEITQQPNVALVFEKDHYQPLQVPVPPVSVGQVTLLEDRMMKSNLPYSKTAVLSTVAGKPIVQTFLLNAETNAGYANGSANAARFNHPSGLAVDDQQNVYVADTRNHAIRKISVDGQVTTLAGGNGRGWADGPGSQAQFDQPTGIAQDHQGNFYVTDTFNDCVRKITAQGQVSTLAGGRPRHASRGFVDGTGVQALFDSPTGIAVDAQGTVYVADTGNDAIRKITPTGQVTTLAGQPNYQTAGPGVVNQWVETLYDKQRRTMTSIFIEPGRDHTFANGAGSQARLNAPHSVVVDRQGIIYVSDTGNGLIRKITPDGQVSTFVGALLETPGVSSHWPTELRPQAMAIDRQGQLYLQNMDGGIWDQQVLKLSPTGEPQIWVQTNDRDAQHHLAGINGLATDLHGNVYVSDATAQQIRKITPCDGSSLPSECTYLVPQYLTPAPPVTRQTEDSLKQPVPFQPYRFTIRIENISPAYTLSKGIWALFAPNKEEKSVFHPLFTPGEPDRRQGLEALAEEGINYPLMMNLNPWKVLNFPIFTELSPVVEPNQPLGRVYQPNIIGKEPGIIASNPEDHLFFALKLMESNDVFFSPAPEGIPLYDAQKRPLQGDITHLIKLWDAGTEVNEPLGQGSHQPGRQAANNTGVDEHGVVHVAGPEYPPIEQLIKVTVTAHKTNEHLVLTSHYHKVSDR